MYIWLNRIFFGALINIHNQYGKAMRSKYMHGRPIISYTDGVHIRYCDFMYTKFTYLQAPHTDIPKAYSKYTHSNRVLCCLILSHSHSHSLYLSLSFSFGPVSTFSLIRVSLFQYDFVVSSSFFHFTERTNVRMNERTSARSSARSPFRMSCLFSCCFSFLVYEIENAYTSYTE